MAQSIVWSSNSQPKARFCPANGNDLVLRHCEGSEIKFYFNNFQFNSHFIVLDFTAHRIQLSQIRQLVVPFQSAHLDSWRESRRFAFGDRAAMLIVHVQQQALWVIVQFNNASVFRAQMAEMSFVNASDVLLAAWAQSRLAIIVVETSRLVIYLICIDGRCCIIAVREVK